MSQYKAKLHQHSFSLRLSQPTYYNKISSQSFPYYTSSTLPVFKESLTTNFSLQLSSISASGWDCVDQGMWKASPRPLSHNCSWAWRTPLGIIWSNAPLSAGSPAVGCLGLCPAGFWIYPGMEPSRPSWVTCASVWPSFKENAFSYV